MNKRRVEIVIQRDNRKERTIRRKRNVMIHRIMAPIIVGIKFTIVNSILTRHRPRNRIQITAVFIIPGVIQPVIRNTKDTGTMSLDKVTVSSSNLTIIRETKAGNLGTRCQSSRHTEIVSQRTGLKEIRIIGTNERMHKAFLSHSIEVHPVLPEVTITDIEEVHGGSHGSLKREGHRKKLQTEICIDLEAVTG